MDQLQTRTEHSRSLEDAEHYKAIDTLVEVGLLIRVEDLETFHGRVKRPDETEEWSVDPAFANGSNDSGNYNLNDRSTLYTSEEQVAKDFSERRAQDIIRPLWMEKLQDKVKAYSPEEKQQWLERVNEDKRTWWEGLKPEQREWFKSGPGGSAPQLELEELDEHNNIYAEARELGKRLPKEEAQELWEQSHEGYERNLHNIIAKDKDATVINDSFKFDDLSEVDLRRAHEAMRKLIPPVTEGSPVDFNSLQDTTPFIDSLKKRDIKMPTVSDLKSIATDEGLGFDVVMKLGAAINARYYAGMRPEYLARLYLRSGSDMVMDKITQGESQEELPISLEYAERFFRLNHIVGVQQRIISSTLNRNIASTSFFDLEKVNSEDRIEEERTEILQKLGGIADELEMLHVPELQEFPEVIKLLQDAYVKPEKLVEAAMNIEGYKDIFEADAGNWEGYTLAEHTETVLRNFDENFADELPVELLTPLRLALLAHDVGKPAAARNGEKHKQKEYNIEQARDFFEKVDVPEPIAELLLTIIGEGQELAYKAIIRGNPSAALELREVAKSSLAVINEGKPVDNGHIEGYLALCELMLTCDGGAYTDMAITRRPGVARFRNAPSFNDSFARPIGLGKRGIKLIRRV